MSESNKENWDIASEALFIGCIYQNPTLYVNYEQLVRSKYDFYDDDLRFLYDSFEIFYKTFSQEVTKSKVEMFMQKENERYNHYKKIGGWSSLNKQMELSDPDDVQRYFDAIKKYSLVREFDRKGFPVAKLINHKSFPKMKAEDIINFMNYNISHISTVIGGGKSAVILGNNALDKVEEWMIEPDMGMEFPFPLWTDLFRGWRKRKLIIDGMLSNEGKSRKVARIAAFLGILHQKPCLILANEMDEEEFLAMTISTVMNSKEFGFNYGIKERNVLLGEYESEEEANKVREVAKYIREKSKVYFLEMNAYSDDDLKREIKKYTLLGVEYVFYDTMKGFQTDAWDSLKRTATFLKDIANELDIGVYASIQLTDDAENVNIEDFSSSVIANSKQIKHVCDHMLLGRRIPISKYSKYKIRHHEWGVRELDSQYIWYATKAEKNRGGEKGVIMVYRVNLDCNTWEECGVLEVIGKGG